MAASPTVVGFAINKWITAITDLMALTQKRQLLWREETAAKDPYPGPCYVTEFNGNTLVLQRNPSENLPGSGWLLRSLLSGAAVGNAYTLRAFKPNGELLTIFPSNAALNGLKIAIEAQLQKERGDLGDSVKDSVEDSFLQSIHQTAKNAVQS